jgi:hypothetical protein
MSLDCHKKTHETVRFYSGHKDVFGIMEWDKPSPTLTGGCLHIPKGRFVILSKIELSLFGRLQDYKLFPMISYLVSPSPERHFKSKCSPVKLVEASAETIFKVIEVLKKED